MTATITSRKISIRRNAAAIGAEIAGVDLAQELDDETFEQVKNAYYQHSVIVFRDQKLTPQQQVSFSRRFSELEIHVTTSCPGILKSWWCRILSRAAG